MFQVAGDLWCSDMPFRFAGLEFGARMTVARLPSGGLFLHSPIRASETLVSAVRELGEVRYLIAPNLLHHLFVRDWVVLTPSAELHVAPGLGEKRADLSPTAILGEKPDEGWADAIDQVVIGGWPFASEVAFFHRSSSTLILTDMAFNFGSNSPPLTRLFGRIAGCYESLGPTLLEKLTVRDRIAFRHSLERILAWPFERVIVSHGNVAEKGARAQLERNYAWVLAP